MAHQSGLLVGKENSDTDLLRLLRLKLIVICFFQKLSRSFPIKPKNLKKS
jgi:hypothetical protein